MRIAYVCADPGIEVFGTKGASVHIQEVVRELRRRGHDVIVYALRRGKEIPTDLADLQVEEYPLEDTATTAQRERAQRRASARIAEQIRAHGMPDLIFERYSLFSSVLADLCGGDERAKTRSDSTAKPAGGVASGNGAPTAGGIPPERDVFKGVRPEGDVTPEGDVRTAGGIAPIGVLEVNAPLIEEQRTHRELVDEDTAWELLRQQCAAAQAVICVSDPVKQWVSTHTGSTRVHTVPNGVNVERIRPQSEASDPAVVTFVGTLKPWHGVADLLRAASVAKGPWRLRIIGNGPERDRLEHLARQLHVDAEFHGAVSPADIPEHLAGTAIGVAPYPAPRRTADHYFSPLKVHEYLAAGLPVVASAVGQLPDLLRGVGMLVPPSDPRSLAGALDFLAINPQERARLGRLARQRAERQHSWSAAVDRILRLAGLPEASAYLAESPAGGSANVVGPHASSPAGGSQSGGVSTIADVNRVKGDA